MKIKVGRRRGFGVLPVGKLIQGHKIDLARSAGAHRRKKDLVVAFTQKLELLDSFVHENAVQLTGLHIPDLNGLVAPAHDLSIRYVGDRGRQLAPLQHNVLDEVTVRVHVDALVVVAEEQMHAARVGQHHDRVWLYVEIGGRDAGRVYVAHVARVEIDGVEANVGAVEHLHAGLLLDRQVHQQRLVLQVRERLERHEFAVGLLCPCVHLDAVLQAHHQKLDLVELDYFEMYAALQLANVHKARLFLILLYIKQPNYSLYSN